MPPADTDDVSQLLPKKKIPWGGIAIVLVGLAAAAFAFWAYSSIEQRGLSVRGEGQLVRTPKAGTWVLLLDGTLVRATAASAARLGADTGPCALVDGYLKGHELELEELQCSPGEPLLRRVGERIRRMNLRFAYWAPGVERVGEGLEPHLANIEIVAAMVDPRFDDPQLLPLYVPLFPETLAEARREGLPPPVVIQVKRNDFLLKRMSGTEVAAFLDRDRFVFAAAHVKGGWLVREVTVAPGGTPSIERLLVAPEEPPWPSAMADPTLRVSRRGTPTGGPGEPPPRGDAGE